MPPRLRVSLGQYSDKGRKAINQDFHGAVIPAEPLLSTKGVGARAGRRHQQQRRQPHRQRVRGQELPRRLLLHLGGLVGEDVGAARAGRDQLLAACRRRGRASTATTRTAATSARSARWSSSRRTAHLFHVGDARIYRLRGTRARAADRGPPRLGLAGAELSQPRARRQSADSRSTTARSRSSRATSSCSPPTASTSTSTRARHRPARSPSMRDDLDAAARAIVAEAFERGSADNLTVQIVARRRRCPSGDADEVLGQQSRAAAAAAARSARMLFDGYRIVRELHGSSRSHVYLAVDSETDAPVVLKTPSTDLRDDAGLSRALPDGGVDRAAHQQPARAQAARRRRASATTSTSSRSTSTARPWRSG